MPRIDYLEESPTPTSPSVPISDTSVQSNRETIDRFNTRAGMLPLSFVQDAPWTAAWLVTSALFDHHLEKVGDALQRGWEWIKSMNGPDGMYVGERASALLHEPDPDARAFRHAEIDDAIARHRLADYNTRPEPQERPEYQPGPVAGRPEVPAVTEGDFDSARKFYAFIKLHLPDSDNQWFSRMAIVRQQVAEGVPEDKALQVADRLTGPGFKFTPDDISAAKSVQLSDVQQAQLVETQQRWHAFLAAQAAAGRQELRDTILNPTFDVNAVLTVGSLFTGFGEVSLGAKLVGGAVLGLQYGHGATKAGTGVVAGGLDAVGAHGFAAEAEKAGGALAKGVGAANKGLQVGIGRASDFVVGGGVGAVEEINAALQGTGLQGVGEEGVSPSFKDWWHRYAFPHDPGVGAGQAFVDLLGLDPKSAPGKVVAGAADFASQIAVLGAVGREFAAVRQGGREIDPAFVLEGAKTHALDEVVSPTYKGPEKFIAVEAIRDVLGDGDPTLIQGHKFEEPIQVGQAPDGTLRIVEGADQAASAAAAGYDYVPAVFVDDAGHEIDRLPSRPEVDLKSAEAVRDIVVSEEDARQAAISAFRQDRVNKYGVTGNALYELRQRISQHGIMKGLEDYFQFGGGHDDLVRMQKLQDSLPLDEARVRLRNVSRGTVTLEEADRLLRTQTVEEKARVIVNILRRERDQEQVSLLEREAAAQDQLALQGSALFDDAERTHLKYLIQNWNPREVPLVYPKVSRLMMWLSEARADVSGSWLAAMWDKLSYLPEGGKRFPLVPDFDSLFTRQRDYNFRPIFGAGSTPDAREFDANLARIIADRMGVRRAISDALIGQLTEVHSIRDQVKWSERFAESLADSQRVAADQKPVVRRFWRDSADSMYRGTYSEVAQTKGGPREVQSGIIQSVVDDEGHVEVSPGLTAEHARFFPGMNPSDIREYTSWTGRIERKLEEGRVPGPKFVRLLEKGGFKAAKWTIDIPLSVLDGTSQILRSVFVTAHTPGIVAKHLFEYPIARQAAGERLGFRNIFGRDDELNVFNPTPQQMQQDRMWSLGATVDREITWGEEQPVPSYYTGGDLPDNFANKLIYRFHMLHGSEEARTFVQLDLDEGKMVKWLKNHPSGQRIMRDVQPDLDAHHMTAKEWVSNIKKHILTVTGGHEGLIDAIQSGKFGTTDEPVNAHGESVSGEINRLRTQIRKLDRLAETAYRNGAESLGRSYIESKIEDAVRLKQLKDQRYGLPEGDTVSLFDAKGLRAKLKEMTRTGEYKPPSEVVGPEMRPESGTYYGERLASRIADFIYKPASAIGWADKKFNRLPFYRTRAKWYYDEYRAFGYGDEEAKAIAELKAVRDTRTWHYDLLANSTADRAVRNIFWFTPMLESAARRWLIDIPSRYYWPVGVAFLAERAHLYHQLFRDLGLVHSYTDSKGKKHEVLAVPGVGSFLAKMLHLPKPIADVTEVDPRGFLAITSEQGIYPRLAAPYQVVLHRLVGGEGHSLAGHLSSALTYQGGGVLPRSVDDVVEWATGRPLPSYLTGSHRAAQDQLAYLDAQSQAVSKLESEGVAPPSPPDFSGMDDAASGKAMDAWLKKRDAWDRRVDVETKNIFRWTSFYRSLWSLASPSAATTSDNIQNEVNGYHALFQKLYPKGTNQQYLDWRSQKLAKLKAQYPFLEMYGVGEFAVPDQQAFRKAIVQHETFYQRLQAGLERIRSPEERLQLLHGWSARDFYVNLRQSLVEHAVGKSWNDVTLNDVLTHMGDYSQAEADYTKDWVTYLGAPENSVFRHDYIANQQSAPGYDLTSLLDTTRTLGELARASTSLTQYRDVKSVSALLGSQIDALLKLEKANPSTQRIARELADYRDNVMGPYFDQSAAVFSLIDKAKAAGTSTEQYFLTLRDLKMKYEEESAAKGLVSPDEVGYYAAPEGIRAQQRASWTLQPVEWLTPFERKTVGYQDPKGWDSFASWLSGFKSYVRDQLQANSVSTSSSYYVKSVKPWMEQQIVAEASKHGQGVVDLYRLSQAAPYVRLSATNPEISPGQHLDSDPRWSEAVSYLDSIYSAAKTYGVEVSGDTVADTPWKNAFFEGFQRVLDADPALAEYFGTELAFGAGTDQRPQVLGPDLWDMVFFGNRTSLQYGYIPRYPQGQGQ